MSSTRPIISANRAARAALAVVLAAGALVTAALAVRDAVGADAAERGDVALREALRMSRGLERDAKLDDAQAILKSGLGVTPGDPRLWNLLGETRLMQATRASVEEVSPELLAAAADASAHAAELSPRDAGALARLAFVRSLEDQPEAAAAALEKSYAAGDLTAGAIDRRLEAVGRSWKALSENVRQAALNETCVRAAQGPTARARLMNLRMGPADPELALAIDRALADPACGANPASAAHP